MLEFVLMWTKTVWADGHNSVINPLFIMQHSLHNNFKPYFCSKTSNSVGKYSIVFGRHVQLTHNKITVNFSPSSFHSTILKANIPQDASPEWGDIRFLDIYSADFFFLPAAIRMYGSFISVNSGVPF